MKGAILTNAHAADHNPYNFYKTPWDVTQYIPLLRPSKTGGQS